MEQENSSNSLLSRRSSEDGSSYGYESGFYISAFVAKIMMAALASIAAVILILLVILVVLLQSCQTRNRTCYEVRTSNQYEFFRSAAFHAELNGLAKDDLPAVCKRHDFPCVHKGYLLRDLNFTLQLARDYFSTVKLSDDGSDAVLVDIDDVVLPEVLCCNGSLQYQTNDLENMTTLAGRMVFRFLYELQTSGWSIHFFSRTTSCNPKLIVEATRIAGFKERSSFITRSDSELPLENWEHVEAARLNLQKQGFRIASVISGRMDAFHGSLLGERRFKLPSPLLQDSTERAATGNSHTELPQLVK